MVKNPESKKGGLQWAEAAARRGGLRCRIIRVSLGRAKIQIGLFYPEEDGL